MPDDRNDAPYRTVEELAELDLGQRARMEEYWPKLEATLRKVFGRTDAGSLADAYREKLRQAGPETELHAYHLDPLQVAADLTGHGEISPEEKVAYTRRVLAAFDPNADLPADATLDYRVPEDASTGP